MAATGDKGLAAAVHLLYLLFVVLFQVLLLVFAVVISGVQVVNHLERVSRGGAAAAGAPW